MNRLFSIRRHARKIGGGGGNRTRSYRFCRPMPSYMLPNKSSTPKDSRLFGSVASLLGHHGGLVSCSCFDSPLRVLVKLITTLPQVVFQLLNFSPHGEQAESRKLGFKLLLLFGTQSASVYQPPSQTAALYLVTPNLPASLTPFSFCFIITQKRLRH